MDLTWDDVPSFVVLDELPKTPDPELEALLAEEEKIEKDLAAIKKLKQKLKPPTEKVPEGLIPMTALPKTHPFLKLGKDAPFPGFAEHPDHWLCQLIGKESNSNFSVWEVRVSENHPYSNTWSDEKRWYYGVSPSGGKKVYGGKPSIPLLSLKEEPLPVPRYSMTLLALDHPFRSLAPFAAHPENWLTRFIGLHTGLGVWEVLVSPENTWQPDHGWYYGISGGVIVKKWGSKSPIPLPPLPPPANSSTIMAVLDEVFENTVKAAHESPIPDWAKMKITVPKKVPGWAYSPIKNWGTSKGYDLLSMAVDFTYILYSGKTFSADLLPADHPYVNPNESFAIKLNPAKWVVAFVGHSTSGREVWKTRKITSNGMWFYHEFKEGGHVCYSENGKSYPKLPPNLVSKDYTPTFSFAVPKHETFYCESCEQDTDTYQCGNCSYCPECCGCEKDDDEDGRGTTTSPPWEARGIKVDLSEAEKWKEGDQDVDRVWKTWGINPQAFSPTEAFCDFYLLEAISSQLGLAPLYRNENTKFLADEARTQLTALITEADAQLTGYMRMAMWGEARHHQALRNNQYLTADRWTAWLRGAQLEKEIGPECYTDLATLFLELGGSVGGRMWATAANLLAERMSGKISGLTWVDRILTLIHNGGSLFNKAPWSQPHKGSLYWTVELIPQILGPAQADACTFWPMLILGANPQVRNLWWRWELERNRARRDLGQSPVMSERSWVNRLNGCADLLQWQAAFWKQYKNEKEGKSQQIPSDTDMLEKEVV